MKIVDESKYLIKVKYSDFHLNHRFYKKKTINGKLEDNVRETKSLSTQRIMENNINEDDDNCDDIYSKKRK